MKIFFTFLTLIPIIVKCHFAIEAECFFDDYYDYFDSPQTCHIKDIRIPHNVSKEEEGAFPKLRDQEEVFITNAQEYNFSTLSIKNSTFLQFPQEMLKQLPYLEEIIVESCDLKVLWNFTFYHYPAINIVDGDDRKVWYEKTKGTFLRSLKVLHLDRNQIHYIAPFAFFALWNLTELSMAHNQLDTIDPGLFKPLWKLRKLNLANNRIKTLDKNVFSVNRLLRSINLAENAIEHTLELNLPQAIFNLNVNDNKITCLYLKTSTQSLLNEVSATSNKIVNFQFNTNINIGMLELRNNEIASLESLTNLTALHRLYIEKNQLTSLVGLEKFTKLTHLFLGGNNVEITSNTFASLINLHFLTLSEANLTKFNIDCLGSALTLRILNLNENQLTELDYVKLAKLPNLHGLLINGNNFNCSHLKEMMEYLEKRSIHNNLYIAGGTCVKDSPRLPRNSHHFLFRIFFITLGIFVSFGVVFGVIKYGKIMKMFKN